MLHYLIRMDPLSLIGYCSLLIVSFSSKSIDINLTSSLYREPEVHAVWSITCLLMAASINPTVRALINVVAYRYSSVDLDWLLSILCTVACHFYCQEVCYLSPLSDILCLTEFSTGSEEAVLGQV